MKFYLGADRAHWLAAAGVPLFVSHRTLRKLKTLPRAAAPWALDSGGFTELSRPPHRWTISPEEYVDAVARYADNVGHLEWAAPQDSMCEPFILDATGGTVESHQAATVANLLRLRELAPGLPFAPVVQGWTVDDYHRCVDLYASAGVDLTLEPIVGVGSVCRRQASGEIAMLGRSLAARGIRLHGFGVKLRGLARLAPSLTSADSFAWSFSARRQRLRLPACTHRAATCHNCLAWALQWRATKAIAAVDDSLDAEHREPRLELAL